MSLVPALTALCESLGTQTGAQVTLGRPEDHPAGIYVWPWRIDEDAVPRNVPPRRVPEGGMSARHAALIVHALVLVRPATTPGGLALLETARQAIHDQPVLNVSGKRVQILFEPLSHSELAALFRAAELPLTVCLSVVLRTLG